MSRTGEIELQCEGKIHIIDETESELLIRHLAKLKENQIEEARKQKSWKQRIAEIWQY